MPIIKTGTEITFELRKEFTDEFVDFMNRWHGRRLKQKTLDTYRLKPRNALVAVAAFEEATGDLVGLAASNDGGLIFAVALPRFAQDSSLYRELFSRLLPEIDPQGMVNLHVEVGTTDVSRNVALLEIGCEPVDISEDYREPPQQTRRSVTYRWVVQSDE